MNGFFNVLKPAGMTASDVVVRLRKLTGEKKAGHLGTLDPGATGVLPIALGKATKLFDLLTKKQKCYRAFFTFGKTTDTLDSYGVVTEETGVVPTEAQIRAALPSFHGVMEQFSAVSVGGVRAYRLARMGKEVTLTKKSVEITEFRYIEKFSENTYVFDVRCSGGTYIRSLARDLAAALGTVAYMSGLIRMESGAFTLENAVTFEQLQKDFAAYLLPLEYPLQKYEVYEFPKECGKKLSNGVKCRADFEGYRRIYCNDVFYGVGRCEKGVCRLDYFLYDGDEA